MRLVLVLFASRREGWDLMLEFLGSKVLIPNTTVMASWASACEYSFLPPLTFFASSQYHCLLFIFSV